MRDADVARLAGASLRLGFDVLEELHPVPIPGKPQVRHTHVRVRVADDRRQVSAALLLLEDDLHAQGVTVERERALEVANGEARVGECRHQNVIVTPPSTVTTCPVR